jgi:hypothetical protein
MDELPLKDDFAGKITAKWHWDGKESDEKMPIRRTIFAAYKAIVKTTGKHLRLCDITIMISGELADAISECKELETHVNDLWHRGLLNRNSLWQLGDTLYGMKLIVSVSIPREYAELTWGDGKAIPTGSFHIAQCL